MELARDIVQLLWVRRVLIVLPVILLRLFQLSLLGVARSFRLRGRILSVLKPGTCKPAEPAGPTRFADVEPLEPYRARWDTTKSSKCKALYT